MDLCVAISTRIPFLFAIPSAIAMLALIAFSLVAYASGAGAVGHLIYVKLPPMWEDSVSGPFRELLQTDPLMLPYFSNVVTLVSTETQKDYDVWLAWMPESMSLARYFNEPGLQRPSMYRGTWSLMQLLQYLWPIFAVATSEVWMELLFYKRGYGARIDLRYSTDPLVWYYAFHPTFQLYGLKRSFWEQVAPTLFLSDGSIDQKMWPILARLASGKLPLLPTGRSGEHVAVLEPLGEDYDKSKGNIRPERYRSQL